MRVLAPPAVDQVFLGESVRPQAFVQLRQQKQPALGGKARRAEASTRITEQDSDAPGRFEASVYLKWSRRVCAHSHSALVG